MKITVTQGDVTSVIEVDRDSQTVYEMVDHFRGTLGSLGYANVSIDNALPTEEDIDDIVDDAIKTTIENMLEDEDFLLDALTKFGHSNK